MTDNKQDSQQSKSQTRLRIPCDKSRILIVDDERMIRDVFQAILSFGLPGCKIDVAANGAEAVKIFRDIHHGLVLMDLRMPVMDGEMAFKEIEKLCLMENVEMPAVIFCTGYVPSEEISKKVANNPKHHILRKPVTNDLLLETIKSRLQKGESGGKL